MAYYRDRMREAAFTLYKSGKILADLLYDARLHLSAKEWEELIQDCPLEYSVICKLLKMASNLRLNDLQNERLLPEAWTLRFEIMQMEEATFRRGIDAGIISPTCTLTDLKKLRRETGELASPKRVPRQKAAPVVAALEQNSKSAITPVSDTDVVATTDPTPIGYDFTVGDRVTVVVSQQTADAKRSEIDALSREIAQVVERYPFVGSVLVTERTD